MIPTPYFITLMITLICILNVFLEKSGIFLIKKRNPRMICNFLLYAAFGISYTYANIVNTIDSLWLLIIICGIIGLLSGILLLVITWTENKSVINKNTGMTYTPDMLVGMTGAVVCCYTGNKFCGKLDDELNTDIIVKIPDGDGTILIPYGAKFVITDISGCDINAKLTD